MKPAALAVFCVVAATAASPGTAVQRDTTITRTLRFSSGAERLVDIRAITGSIEVTGYDGTDVQIEVRRTIDAETDAARRQAEQDVAVTFEEGGSRVAAIVRDSATVVCGERGEWSRGWRRRGFQVTFDFTVRVPRDARLRLCTINGGSVRVDGTSGEFDVSNINGPITMTGLRGSGSATTVNGRLEAAFLDSPRAASVFKTVNGDVDLTFPATLAADFTMKTMHGDLWSEFDVDVLPQRVAAAERRNDKYVYRSNAGTRVRIGAGGPEIALETLNGDVRLRRAAR